MAPGMVADRPPALANRIGQTGRNSFAPKALPVFPSAVQQQGATPVRSASWR